MVGPADFTTNDECGVLLEGYERTPLILSPWTHRYYPALLEGAGMAKAMDLLMWELAHLGPRQGQPGHLEARRRGRGAPRRRRPAVPQEGHQAEIARFMEVYNSAWERNWGFVPLTEKEVRHYATQLKPFLDENWAYVAEKDGETVGAALTLPDYNQVLLHMNGRLLPFGWAQVPALRREDRPRARVRAGREAASGSTRASPRSSTSATSTPRRARRRTTARWAGSSRRTRT